MHSMLHHVPDLKHTKSAVFKTIYNSTVFKYAVAQDRYRALCNYKGHFHNTLTQRKCLKFALLIASL